MQEVMMVGALRVPDLVWINWLSMYFFNGIWLPRPPTHQDSPVFSTYSGDLTTKNPYLPEKGNSLAGPSPATGSERESLPEIFINSHGSRIVCPIEEQKT
jgi:hypothetical protein